MLSYTHRLRRAAAAATSSTLLLRHHHTPPPPLHIPKLHTPPPSSLFKPATTSLSSMSRSFSTTLFQATDKNHWLIIIDFPQDHKPTQKELVTLYEETAAKIFGSLEEAKQKIYACSTTDYIGFQVECSEETSAKFKDLPEVLLVVPDSYIDPVKKEYGGDIYIDGRIISKPLPSGYLLLGSTEVDEDRSSNKASMEGDIRYNQPVNPQQNLNMPNPSPSKQNYGPPHSLQQQYDSPLQNFMTSPPDQSIMEWANNSKPATPQQNLSTPSLAQGSPSPSLHQNFGPSPPQQNYGPQHPPQQQYGPPQQNISMSPSAQLSTEGVYTNCSPPVTPQQNFSTPSQAQWRASPSLLQQNFGTSRPSHPPQQQCGPHQQNFSMPPPAQSNMAGVYTNYSPPVTPQQNFSTPSQTQWSPSPPHQNYVPPHPCQQQYDPPHPHHLQPQWSPPPPRQQQNFCPSQPHQNYGPPHPPQQQYVPLSNFFPQHQNYGQSPPQNFDPAPPQQSYYQPGSGDLGGPLPPYSAS